MCAALVASTVSVVSAHRLDEYLQAARIGLEPDRVVVELDLTPGVSLASRVIGEIDEDRNGDISPAEVRGYAMAVGRDLRLDVDGHPVTMTLLDSRSDSAAAMTKGEGTVRVRWNAPLPALAPGAHRLSFRNRHAPDVGVYLANALVPENDRVAVTAQDRDVNQRDLTVSYELRPAPGRSRRPLAAAVGGVVAGLVLLMARRSMQRRLPPRRRPGVRLSRT